MRKRKRDRRRHRERERERERDGVRVWRHILVFLYPWK